MDRGASRATFILAVSATLLAGGCAHQQHQRKVARQPVERQDPVYVDPHGYEAVTASALVFDPPVADVPADALVREGRERTAFVGYDSIITTFFYLRTDDRIRLGEGQTDRYERRAISERFGVSER
jgi:hypothetical protein